jgi:hypothetical protein
LESSFNDADSHASTVANGTFSMALPPCMTLDLMINQTVGPSCAFEGGASKSPAAARALNINAFKKIV